MKKKKEATATLKCLHVHRDQSHFIIYMHEASIFSYHKNDNINRELLALYCEGIMP